MPEPAHKRQLTSTVYRDATPLMTPTRPWACPYVYRNALLQHTATRCNTLQHAATHFTCSFKGCPGVRVLETPLFQSLAAKSTRAVLQVVNVLVLQCVALCCLVLRCVELCCSELLGVVGRCGVWPCVAVCCSAFQCGVAVRRSVLQCVAVRCSVLQSLDAIRRGV